MASTEQLALQLEIEQVQRALTNITSQQSGVDDDEQPISNSTKCEGLILESDDIEDVMCGETENGTSNNTNNIDQIEEENRKSRAIVKYLCNICNDVFDTEADYYIHVQIHKLGSTASEDETAGDVIEDGDDDDVNRIYKCPVCEKAFTQQGNVKVHLRVHDKVRPYPCQVCGKSFTQLGNLQTHMHIHSNSKPFVCDVCLRGFTQAGNVKKHRESVHVGKDPLVCDICQQVFHSSTKLAQHARGHVPEGQEVGTPPKTPKNAKVATQIIPMENYKNADKDSSSSSFNQIYESNNSMDIDTSISPKENDPESQFTRLPRSANNKQILVTQTADNKRKIFVPRDFDLSACRRIRMEVYYCTLCKLSFRSDRELTDHLSCHD